jgi:hypothetical protein
MSNNGDFSLEDSEELIANLKSGKPSDFEQLRSALNLVAHVTELPPTSIPPVLPSGITQPIPVIPVKPANPRRTIVTSVIVIGMFASASLAAAAVTGIGPAPIVEIGHKTAKFVKGVAGAVSNVVTGGNAVTTVTIPPVPTVPGITPAPTGNEESSSDNSNNNEDSNSGSLTVTIPLLPNPLSTEGKKNGENKDGKSNEGKSSEGKSSDGKSNDGKSNENQSNNQEDSNISPLTILPTPTIKIETEHSESDGQKSPEINKTSKLPTALPSPSQSENSSDDE